MILIPLVAAAPIGFAPDHDLFRSDEGVAPYFKMVESAPVVGPIPFDPGAAPDALLVRAPVELPVGGKGQTLALLLAAAGGLESKGVAGDVELRYADGRTQTQKLLVGEHVWPAWAGATGRAATPVSIGVNAGGDVITAALLVVDLSFPDTELRDITLKTRGNIPYALLGAALDVRAPWEVQADRRPGEWLLFPIPSDQPKPLPGALPNPPILGPLRVVDGHLVDQAGARARMWGINLVGPGALPAEPERVARSLAHFGFNLARLHHIDGEDTLLNPRRFEPGAPMLDPDALDRFDRMHAALGAAGIRVFAENWTRRAFRTGEGPFAPEGLVTGHKYVAFFEPEWLDAQKAWFRALYDRTNPHTGLAYRDDPTIGLIELANEQSLLVAWNSGALEKLPKPHRALLDARWNAWLRARYGNDTRLATAWAGPSRGGLLPGETLSLDSIAREPSARTRTELFPTRRSADLVLFYGELEAAYFAEMARFVREDLGFVAPIVCTASMGVPLADAQLAACDVVDLHLYWDSAPESNVFSDTSIVTTPGRWLEKLASCQSDKPCTISELNHIWPNRKSQEAPMFWAGLAARQDIDAVVWFAWSHAEWRPVPDGPMGSLDLEGRDSTLAQLPVASALFREGLAVPEARYTRWLSPDALLRDLSEYSSLWLDPLVHPRSWIERQVRTSFARVPPAPTTTAATIGPIRWSPRGLVGESDRTEWVIGAGSTQRLSVAVDGWSAVTLRSLDGQPIGSAGELLLVLAGRTEREGTLWGDHGPNPLVLGKGPARIERLHGVVQLLLDGRWTAESLGPTGEPGEAVRLYRRAGAWTLDVERLDSPWVRLRRR